MVSGAYLDAALVQMIDVARRAEGRLNDRPFGEASNSVGALVVHCVAVAEFWLGHVALGRVSGRDREAEFSARVSVGELENLVERARRSIAADLASLADGMGRPSELRALCTGGPSDESVVLHVLEEFHQHLGHMEAALDAFAHGVTGEALYHLALRSDWESALGSGGPYTVSTIGRSLEDVGFIHLSRLDQLQGTARRYYGGRSDVVVLQIDPRGVAPVRYEPSDTGEHFPHLYGPLPVGAVVAVTPYRAE
jgi:uncharacterized protein (DUF952 family)